MRAPEVERVVASLSLEEKCALTAGGDLWSTSSNERLGIPALKMTDGPNGARGMFLHGGPSTAACVPCGSALGATWDEALIEAVGALVGAEARTKACRVLLGPTLNLPRSPLAGRNFECYSEDPLLSGKVAAAFVRGVQSEGVVATLKHFVANDSEFERGVVDAVVDERSLRELYLVPFEIAVREAGALGIMTAYNLVNGTYCSEHRWLLEDVLRHAWGFEGIVMTDWYAAGSALGSGVAGLDLEMPGPGRFFGVPLAQEVSSGRVDEALVDDKVRRLLRVIGRVGAWADPVEPQAERSIDDPAHRVLARRAAAAAMVLLRNDDVLPFDVGALASLAVIGPNATRAHMMGGGSASLNPHYRVTPLEAIRARLGDAVRVVHEPGCSIERSTPGLDPSLLTTPTGQPGLEVEFYADDAFGGAVVHRMTSDESRFVFFGPPAAEVPAERFSFRARGWLTPTTTGSYTFTLAQAGRARLVIAGQAVLDGFAHTPSEATALSGFMSDEMHAAVSLEAGQAVELLIEYSSDAAPVLRAVQIGCRPPDSDDLLARAVEAAAGCDAAVIIVGTSEEWESEGFDRRTMDLPGAQDLLVEAVVAANPNSVVVVNAGAPVSMPWANTARATLQAWLGGQEMANALVEVLIGEAEPGGRLPVSIPARVEDTPAYGNFPGENGRIRYGEGVLVGYRWYETRDIAVQFPFGHGLSYTRFELGEPTQATTELSAGVALRVVVPVTNIGSRAGSEVVQCYVRPRSSRLCRPRKELKAFAKLSLEAGETRTVTLELGPRAFAYWDPGDPTWRERNERVPAWLGAAIGVRAERREPGWCVDAGEYELCIGRSSAAIDHVVPVTVTGNVRCDPEP